MATEKRRALCARTRPLERACPTKSKDRRRTRCRRGAVCRKHGERDRGWRNTAVLERLHKRYTYCARPQVLIGIGRGIAWTAAENAAFVCEVADEEVERRRAIER